MGLSTFAAVRFRRIRGFGFGLACPWKAAFDAASGERVRRADEPIWNDVHVRVTRGWWRNRREEGLLLARPETDVRDCGLHVPGEDGISRQHCLECFPIQV